MLILYLKTEELNLIVRFGVYRIQPSVHPRDLKVAKYNFCPIQNSAGI